MAFNKRENNKYQNKNFKKKAFNFFTIYNYKYLNTSKIFFLIFKLLLFDF